MPQLEQMLREYFGQYLTAPVRVTAGGQLQPEQSNHIAVSLLHHAAREGYRLRPDRRLVIELDMSRSVLSVTARSTQSVERFSLDDPSVWEQIS